MAPPEKLVSVAKKLGFEGIVAKRKDSCYEAGKRTGSWLKYKINRSQPFVIGGYTQGNPLDAIIVGTTKAAGFFAPAKCETASFRFFAGRFTRGSKI